MPRFQENSVFTYGFRCVPGCSDTSAYRSKVTFELCPVCGCDSLRKNISGKHYCGHCKRVIEM